VDPACGSGSFLIGAYQYLLNWHKNYYTTNGKVSKGGKSNPLTPEGNLTTAEKKRILLNNIFGVDIDVNAVEVTKLSLLLKCMEGETEASIASQLRLFNERVLPTLDDNIKSGNSLVDTDIYDSQLDLGEEKKIKPFNWQKAFSHVFKHGGFDVVIGNPPYVMLQNLETREVFDYSLRKFESAKYKIDTYQIFTEQSVKLLKENGLLGFITPNTFLKNIHSEPLRKFILNNCILQEILLFNYSVFADASVDTCIFIIEKSKEIKNNKLIVKKADTPFFVNEVTQLSQSQFEKNNRTDYNLTISNSDSEILNKISKQSKPLGTYCGAYFGIQTFDRTKYVSNSKKSKKYEPVIDGGNIEPYRLKSATEFVNYIPSAIKSGGNETVYRQDRICIRQIGATPISTFVPANIFTLNTIYNVYLKEKNASNIKFLLGIINSNATKFFWRKSNSDEKKTFPKIKKEGILSIPVPLINNQNKQHHDEIVKLVNQLLVLNKKKATSKLLAKISQIEIKIEYCENRINHLVYELYDLTEEEIALVES
jgi:hypothetical protein